MYYIISPPPMFNCQIFNYTLWGFSFYSLIVWRSIRPIYFLYIIQPVSFMCFPRKTHKTTILCMKI